MFSAKRSSLKVASVVPVVIVSIITVLLIIKDQWRIDTQPISNMRKRVLRDNEVQHNQENDRCDVLIITQEDLKEPVGGKIVSSGLLTKTYSCPNVYKIRNYECVLDAMRNNSECGGYLFMSRWGINGMRQIEKVIRNDLSRIWKSNKAYRTEGTFNSSNKVLLGANEKDICRNFIRELAALNYDFNVYEMHSKGLLERPWDTDSTLNALLWNGKGRFVCFRELVGMFYVPEKYRKRFLGLARIFNKLKIDDDIAVPTILRSLDLESTFLKI